MMGLWRHVNFMTAEKKGYQKYQSDDIDLSQKDVTVVDKHIKLESEKADTLLK